MKIGFTGTREGMTISQWTQVQDIMIEQWNVREPHEFHDGDCVGADTQAHGSAVTLRNEYHLDLTLHGWPCNLKKYWGHNEYDVSHDVMAPLVRNRLIVMEADLMIAAPKEYEEVERGSGTWATIRYSLRQVKESGIGLYVVYPDGSWKLHYA